VKAYRCLGCSTRQVAPDQPKNCVKCCAGAVWLKEEVALPGMQDVERERAVAMEQSEGEALTARMREPLRDVSATAGRIERESPLFFGTGDNPTLF
jgi:hypothetical protein